MAAHWISAKWPKAPVLTGLMIFLGAGVDGHAETSNTTARTSSTLYCVDARQLGFERQLLLDSIQALANSNATVLFVMQRAEDASWRPAMEQRLGRTFRSLSADEALAQFGQGAPQVIYDPKRRWQLNIATTLAGVHRALLVDHPLEGHDVAFDCRNRWATKVDAYRWAMAELLPQCHSNRLAYLDEGLGFLRDFAMQQRMFVLNLDPLNDPREIGLLEEFLGKFPPQSRVFGWASGAYARKDRNQSDVTVEFALVQRLSRRGLLLVPADFAANLSFYAQTAPYVGQLAQKRTSRRLEFADGKRYVLLVVSDGDNVQYDLGAMRAQWIKDRPKVPVAWTLSPQLAEIGAAVLRSYYSEAADRGGWDEFVAGPSGFAYVNPGSLPSAQLDPFIASTRAAFERADLRSTVIQDDPGRPPLQVGRFLNAYGSAHLDGLWLVGMPAYIGVAEGAAFAGERFRLGRDNAAATAQHVKEVRMSNPFVMIYVNAWENVGDVIRDFAQNLDETCVLVSPTEMAALIRQWITAIARLRQLEARPESLQGLTPVPNPDGPFTTVYRSGVRCWAIAKNASPRYFYLDVNDGFRGAAMEIELVYLDSGTGEIALDYDSLDPNPKIESAYKRHANIVHRANSGQWRLASFPLRDARFTNRENGGTDFRFYNGGDDLIIRAVRVRRPGP